MTFRGVDWPRATARGLWRAMLLTGLLILAVPLAAQTPDSTATPETAPQTRPLAPEASVLLVDTTVADTARTPRRALRRSLLLPGLGQIYNGQAEKTPFVLAGLLGAGAYAAYKHDRYLLYRHAFLYQSRVEAGIEPNEFERFADEWIAAGSLPAVRVRGLRDDARSGRDIAIVITGAVYALQALDAYVSAQLQDFDVSEDLSLHIAPEASGGIALSLRLGL